LEQERRREQWRGARRPSSIRGRRERWKAARCGIAEGERDGGTRHRAESVAVGELDCLNEPSSGKKKKERAPFVSLGLAQDAFQCGADFEVGPSASSK